MSTDGTFDYMYEETPERQNRAIAKMLGPLIEDGEKIGKYLLDEEERSQTIQHQEPSADVSTTKNEMDIDTALELPQQTQQLDINKEDDLSQQTSNVDESKVQDTQPEAPTTSATADPDSTTELQQQNGDAKMDDANEPTATADGSLDNAQEEQPRKPLLCRTLDDKETKVRDTKEKTLISAARFFANREGTHGFFSATLQDYDDCTILLVEI
jgi:hypothetical protein